LSLDMFMEFVPHPFFPRQMIIGPRVAPGAGPLGHQSQVQQVLVAIVKGTFADDDPSATPLPPDQQLGICAADDPFVPGNFTELRYEHDLAAFKPRTDVVVLGAPAPPDPNPIPGTHFERVALGVAQMITTPPFPSSRVTFGWQSRTEGPRLSLAGDAENFDPATMLLPLQFENRFFNGGLYTTGSQPAFTHPASGATVRVETSARYSLSGGGSELRTEVHELHLPDPFPRAVITYRSGSSLTASLASQPLPMVADTIVYDKATGHFYVVWRGVWDFASVPADRYVRLVLS